VIFKLLWRSPFTGHNIMYRQSYSRNKPSKRGELPP
jgi:hypothetical protein